MATTAISQDSESELALAAPEWKWRAPMSSGARTAFGAVSLDADTVLVVGGRNKELESLGSVDVYDRRSNEWSGEGWPELNEPRFGHTAVILTHPTHKQQKIVYVIGGMDGHRRCLPSIEYLNLSQRPLRWRTSPLTLSVPRAGSAAIVAPGGLVYIVGGFGESTTEIMDVSNRRLYRGPRMTTVRYGCAAAVVGNNIWVVGGYDDHRTKLDTVEYLNMESGDWTLCPSRMTEARFAPCAVSIGNSLVVMGGRGNEDFLSSAEVLNTKRMNWWRLPNMWCPRFSGAAVALERGVMVMGGKDARVEAHASTEILELRPITGQDKDILSTDGRPKVRVRLPGHSNSSLPTAPTGHASLPVALPRQRELALNSSPGYGGERTPKDLIIEIGVPAAFDSNKNGMWSKLWARLLLLLAGTAAILLSRFLGLPLAWRGERNVGRVLPSPAPGDYLKITTREPSLPIIWSPFGDEPSYEEMNVPVALSRDGTTFAAILEAELGELRVRINKMKNGRWTRTGPDLFVDAGGDHSSCSVSLSKNGTVLAVGTRKNESDGEEGHVQVYRQDEFDWAPIGSQIGGEVCEDFGRSIALSCDATVLVVGAPMNDYGGDCESNVMIYRLFADKWTQIGQSIAGQVEGDYFGRAVSVSCDASTVAIGAPGNESNREAGYIQVYELYDDDDWAQIGDTIACEGEGDDCGQSLALSCDGKVLAAGVNRASGNEEAAAQTIMYTHVDGEWVPTEYATTNVWDAGREGFPGWKQTSYEIAAVDDIPISGRESNFFEFFCPDSPESLPSTVTLMSPPSTKPFHPSQSQSSTPTVEIFPSTEEHESFLFLDTELTSAVASCYGLSAFWAILTSLLTVYIVL